MNAANMERQVLLVNVVDGLISIGLNVILIPTLGIVGASLALFQLPLPGKLISLPVVAVNGFFLSKHWIFK